VNLKVSFKADRKTLLLIKKAVPEARWQGGELEVTMAESGPAKMAARTKELSEELRATLEGSVGPGMKSGKLQKTLSNAKGSATRK
jgi:hypothetical protein